MIVTLSPTFNLTEVSDNSNSVIGGLVTTTVQVAFLPLLDVAVIVTVPAFLADTVPLLTDAIVELDDDHVIVLFLAVVGVILAVNLNESQINKKDELIVFVYESDCETIGQFADFLKLDYPSTSTREWWQVYIRNISKKENLFYVEKVSPFTA